MGTGLTFSSELLNQYLNGIAVANLTDNAASSPLGSLYVSLHSVDPTSGDQSTNELSYPGYTRVAVARNPLAPFWTVSNGIARPSAAIIFPNPTGGSANAAYMGIGTLSSGAGLLLCAGPLTPVTLVVPNFPPTIATTSTVALT